ncbi:MAG: transposase [Terriglobales bacterium]
MERFSAGQHKAPQEVRTFFVTASTWGRRQIFRSDPLAQLFIRTIDEYRRAGKFLLHEFVLMPDHFHVIITPNYEIPLERAVQFIKGGFSYRVKKEMGSNLEVWSTGFTEHRIKDVADYENHREYIRSNPVRGGLSAGATEYPYSSAAGRISLDARPGLKPISSVPAVSPG